MRKLGLAAAIAGTAIVTAVLTSLFWIAAYSLALRGDEAPAHPEKAITETAESDAGPERVSGPSGLVVPVEGIAVEELVDTYTQARADGMRTHDAIDIIAPAGTPVIAAAEGVVERLFFSSGGGGITVYVRSPDRRWIYYYAHLQDYAPGLSEGQRVGRGDRLGTVGTSGNAGEAGPHLHFAVHRMEPDDDWHGGTPVNPYPLLTRRGEGVR